MALLTIIFVIAALFVANAQLQGDECPQDMVWNNCGSACPRSCNSPPHRFCTLQCVPRCQCKRGLILSGTGGGCVSPHEC